MPCYRKLGCHVKCYFLAKGFAYMPESISLFSTEKAFFYRGISSLQNNLFYKIVTSNFSFSHNVFYPIWHLFFILNAPSHEKRPCRNCEQYRVWSVQSAQADHSRNFSLLADFLCIKR